MRLRVFSPEKDFEPVRSWIADERMHAMWCAGRFQYPLDRTSFTEVLSAARKNGETAFVAEEDGRTVGFFCYSPDHDSGEGRLKFVIVDPERRGKGTAREMLRLALSHAFDETGAAAVRLCVFPENVPAKKCYEKSGFTEVYTAENAFAFREESWSRCTMIIRKQEEKPMYENKTLKQMLENPAIADIAPDAISQWDLSSEEFYHWTLREIADRMGWRTLESGFASLYEAAARGDYYYKLYSEEECADAPAKKNASLVWFRSGVEGADQKPYILLVPGGGFVNVWNLTEGWPVARHFNELGYHVFILTYQICVEAAAVRAMDDIARAMEIIRSHKDRFRVDPDSYITCGFSAGGYIVCLWNTEKGYRSFGLPKPKACFPVYPVTSYRILDAEEWDEGEDKDECAKSGVGCTMKEACSGCFEIPLHTEGFPPTAVFVAAEDDLVDPAHSEKLAEALAGAGIPCRLEKGPTGGHGFADGTGMCMEGWPRRAIEWYEHL